MQAVHGASITMGVAPACEALGVARASFYRWLSPVYGPPNVRRSPRALTVEERAQVLEVLHQEQFMDQSPIEVYATLLSSGSYICSVSTMYRILHENQEVRERRDQRRHPIYTAPQLLAVRANQLWSWDITKLLGATTWTYYHLYVIMDVFSRYIVGWMVAPREHATLAETLIAETCQRQGIQRDQLTIHADRGSSMTSKTVAELLMDLGVIKSHSRPYVSDDNPFSEAAFKTLKYRPGFPARFGCLEDARAHVAAFVAWYNRKHHHSGIALLTPHDVHYGYAPQRIAARQLVLSASYQAHPERFVSGPPQHAAVPEAVWINPPKADVDIEKNKELS